MLTRRAFLHSSSLLALSSTVPLFVPRSMRGITPQKDSRVLVVVELDGGNDALNTVVPYADENYAKLRPNLKLDCKSLVKLNDSLGLHPVMRPLDKLFQAGHLCVVPGVGYPNPNRSHFESMAIWHTARFDPEERKGYGWLGRAMDPSGGTLLSVGVDVPTLLRGRRSSAVGFNNIEEAILSDAAAAEGGIGPETSDDLLAFVRRQAVDAQLAAKKIARLSGAWAVPRYPATSLAGRLQIISRLLKAGIDARVFYTQQSGYDTHARQAFKHLSLLSEFAGAVAAFFADLQESKLADRVMLLTFSEFGRTIKENTSAGTDHGTAGVMFVAGTSVKGGVVGTMPSLSDLDAGEPKMTTDFRSVYGAALQNWLGLPARSVLGGEFARLALLSPIHSGG
jgi:uncharacterized protein (DUF1501 family)